MPGASILDQESTEHQDECFGIDPEATIGTGPFVFDEWRNQDRLLLKPNENYWNGPARTCGLDLRFVYDPETLDEMIKRGELDIVNLDDLGDLGEYYLHGTSNEGKIVASPHIGIDYIALNESIKPLDDVRVRQALQLALDRQTLLDAVYNGAGKVENGIFPQGLYGFNPDLAPISYDVKRAKELLEEAGLSDGFELTVGVRSTSPLWQRQLMQVAKSMWSEIGVKTSIHILSEEEFMSQRTSGKLACYTASWAADYDDPDNFIYTFFGTPENTRYRSLCYPNTDVMKRVNDARSITNEDKRLKEYHELERLIVQQDAAWIPLFSRERHFLVSNRVQDFTTSWNGWFETSYKFMSIKK
jgi:ABC-type transport system substrate-binding protein